MSQSMISRRRNQLAMALRDKEFRDEFVASTISQGIAFQIKESRDARAWSQAELGRRTGKPQPVISQLEDPDYGAYTLKTLRQLASAFDVALVVRFVPFSELLHYSTHLTPDHLAPVEFERDAALHVSEFSDTATTITKLGVSASTVPIRTFASEQLPVNFVGQRVTPNPAALTLSPIKTVGGWRP